MNSFRLSANSQRHSSSLHVRQNSNTLLKLSPSCEINAVNHSGLGYLGQIRSLKTALMQDLLTDKKRVTVLLNDTGVISA
jgi:hypothetical protein